MPAHADKERRARQNVPADTRTKPITPDPGQHAQVSIETANRRRQTKQVAEIELHQQRFAEQPHVEEIQSRPQKPRLEDLQSRSQLQLATAFEKIPHSVVG